MNIHDKIAKLVAMSGSANDHEATNAARRACALLRKHKIPIEDNRSKRYSLRIVHLYHPQKCAYCRKASFRFESCMFDGISKEIFHLSCFLLSLRELDKEIGVLEDEDFEYQNYDEDYDF